MCISVLSTAHPDYPFILISNRDEFISRPTARADWWDPPNEQVLGGRDLQRKERGTWLGITKQGRITILTNFREEGDFKINMSKSRGAMVNSYLTVPPDSTETEEEYVQRLMDDVGIRDVGGFTMLFGKLRRSRGTEAANGHSKDQIFPGLALASNRTESSNSLQRIATTTGETHGISNSHFGDTTWPKVVNGEKLVKEAIDATAKSDSDPQILIDKLFSILCVDALPKRRSEEDWEMFVRHMRNSIMIPPAKGEITETKSGDELRTLDEKATPTTALMRVGEGAYGTSKQTVILVDWSGKVVFVERTLYDGKGLPVSEEERDVRFEFQIEGWDAES